MSDIATRPGVFSRFWFWAGVIVALRMAALLFADGDLGPDEAQYWTWAQDPAFGYFSKPPMIAWIIAATTGVFGDSEWAVRLAAPVLHGAAATLLYLTAAHLYDRRVAMLAGLGWLALPGVSVSSFLITTDAALLVFWSGALLVTARALKAEKLTVYGALALGGLIGAGLLSKYAMLYFIAAAGVAMATSARFRAVFLTPATALTALVAAGLFAPNIAWNAANDFQTVAHTAANANWSASLFQPVSLGAFLLGQIALAGPLLLIAIIAGLAAARRKSRDDIAFVLAIFVLTPLLIVSVQAFISRAHANWAAAAYPAAVIIAAIYLAPITRRALARAAIGLNAVIAAAVLIALTHFTLLDAIGAGRAVSELRGWRDLSAQIASRAEGYDAVLFDDRSMIAEMFYYQPGVAAEIAALDPNNGVHHHYEAFFPFRPEDHKRSLFVSIIDSDAHVNYRFRDIEPRGVVAADVGGDDARVYTLFAISEYFGPPGVQYPDNASDE